MYGILTTLFVKLYYTAEKFLCSKFMGLVKECDVPTSEIVKNDWIRIQRSVCVNSIQKYDFDKNVHGKMNILVIPIDKYK